MLPIRSGMMSSIYFVMKGYKKDVYFALPFDVLSSLFSLLMLLENRCDFLLVPLLFSHCESRQELERRPSVPLKIDLKKVPCTLSKFEGSLRK